jgi:hypothetical protein
MTSAIAADIHIQRELVRLLRVGIENRGFVDVLEYIRLSSIRLRVKISPL